MEATGINWFILHTMLEEADIDACLVDVREPRQIPGRKTDVKDCRWIQEFHCHGLLIRCFAATEKIKELRDYQRLREDHLRSGSMHVNHMQKAFIQMNLRLPEVISQIHRVSGLKIVQAIMAGERNTETP